MSRKRGPRPESAARRAAILDAAASAIAAHGYHGMSMRALAKATGQALAGFYNYFSSKEEVLFHIQANAFETMIATAQDALSGLSSAEDRLFAFLYQHVRYVAEHPDVMRVAVHEASSLPPARRGVVRKLKERYFDLGREIVAELQSRGGAADPLDVERAAYGFFGMLNWVYGWYRPARHGSAGDVARALQRLALHGLLGRGAGRELAAQASVERRLELLRPPSLLGPEIPRTAKEGR